MYIKNKLPIVVIITTLFLLCSICFAQDISINSINFDVPDIIEGDSRITSSKIKISTTGARITRLITTNLEDNSIMGADDTYEKGTEYSLKIGFKAKDGYIFENLIATINGEKVKLDQNGFDEYIIETTLNVISRPSAKVLKSIEFEVDEAVEGEKFTDSFKVKTNLSGKFEKVKFGEDLNGISIDCNLASVMIYTTAVQLDGFINLYELEDLYNPALVEVSDDLVITLNGEEIEYDFSKNKKKINFIEWMDPILTTSKLEYIDLVAFKITPPKIGEKPATEAEASHEIIAISKIVWEPAYEVFAPGKTYTVRIYWVPTLKYNKHLVDDFTTTVNGNKATYGYKDNNGLRVDPYTEYTFAKLDGEAEEVAPKKVEWVKASNWAAEDLNKASEKELVPEVFEQADLTNSVTRREFAHIAVRMYEAVSGQTERIEIIPENPFTDTNDMEVLWAYHLGITKGTGANTFGPDDLITREQMATMLTRALAIAGVDTSVDLENVQKFVDDEAISSWAKESVYYMSNAELIKGMGNNTFGVEGQATREQSLVISLRSVEKLGK